MNKETYQLIKQSFKKIPILSTLNPNQFNITKLSGFTNLNFHLKNDIHDWVLRIPRDKTNHTLNRFNENYNTDIALKLGLTSECIWCNTTGLRLSSTIQKSKCLTKDDLSDSFMLSQLIETLQRLHNSSSAFKGAIDLDELLTFYYHLLPKSKQMLLKGIYESALLKAGEISLIDQKLCPSHNDLVLENILWDKKKLWIIDWEYSSMNTPYWDLAMICNQGEFTIEQSESFIEQYQQGNESLKVGELNQYRDFLNDLNKFWMTAFAQNENV